MAWTDWQLLADRNHWHDVTLAEGPACYQLGLAAPTGIIDAIVYAGWSDNVRERLAEHGRRETELNDLIDTYVALGWHVYYRAWNCDSTQAARDLSTTLRRNFEFLWSRPAPALRNYELAAGQLAM
ncbi:MAG: hypothetical protein U0Q16_22870 [Bryobacteraceae bacterium]